MKDLRSHLDDAAGHAPAGGLDLEALRRRARSRRRARRQASIGAAVGVVALLVGVAVAATAGETTGPTSLLTASASEHPTSTSTDPTEPSTTTIDVTDSTDAATTSRPDDAAPTTTAPLDQERPDPAPGTDLPPATTGSRVSGVAGTFESTPAPAFEVDGSRCPQIVSELDVTLALADGRTWSLHEDGCGEILDHGTRYHGGGPFTIATDDGGTLTGRYESDAPLPTDGEPYTLTITDGTGPWAGASGTCSLDNHMETLSSGLHRQFGTFTCVVSVGDEEAR